MRCALGFEQLNLRRFAHHVHQGNAVGEANAIEHLPKVGGRGGVHNASMPLPAHGFRHT